MSRTKNVRYQGESKNRIENMVRPIARHNVTRIIPSCRTVVVILIVIISVLNYIVLHWIALDRMSTRFSLDFADTFYLQSASKRIHKLPLLNQSFVPLNQSEKTVFNFLDGTRVGVMDDDGYGKLMQGVLHFAIIGFAKTGTSTIMKLLASSDELFVPVFEACKLPQKLNYFLYNLSGFNESEGLNQRRGLKCPNLIENMGVMTPMYPHTNFIIGLRHPIKWFESFYNFRANNSNGNYPAAETKIGSGGMAAVVTDRAQFHIKLAALGKTPMLEEEKKLFSNDTISYVKPSQSKIFLYDVDQLRANNTSTFRTNLKNFLELDNPLSEPAHIIPGKNRTGKLLLKVTKIKIDICEERYNELRKVLLDHGTRAQKWIRTYFLESEDVSVPDRPEFERALENWTVDPCSVGDYEGRRSAIAKHNTMKELGIN